MKFPKILRSVALAACFSPGALLAQAPIVGDTVLDVNFAQGSDFSSPVFNTLTAQNLADYAGSVVLINYYDPF